MIFIPLKPANCPDEPCNAQKSQEYPYKMFLTTFPQVQSRGNNHTYPHGIELSN